MVKWVGQAERRPYFLLALPACLAANAFEGPDHVEDWVVSSRASSSNQSTRLGTVTQHMTLGFRNLEVQQ